MSGQGDFAPQFRHGPPATHPLPIYQVPPAVPPPSFQQVPSQASLPIFQQSHQLAQATSQGQPLAVQQGHPHVVAHRPPLGLPSQYQHGQVAPFQKLVPPPGSINMAQPFPHPPPPSYGNTSIIHSQPPLSQVVSGYQPPITAQSFQNNATLVHLPPRGPPPLPLHPQGRVPYVSPHPLPPGIPPAPAPPPPAPSSFIPLFPAAVSSFDTCLPSVPPPPIPPPPSPPPPPPPSSSPPPLPSSPPPPAAVDEDVQDADFNGLPKDHAVDNAFEKNDISNEIGSGQLDNGVPFCDVSLDTVAYFDKSCAKLEEEHLPSPPVKPGDDILRNIEALCESIVKDGHHVETTTILREAGNPQFAFLIGGEPGSAAAIGHEYFLWMRKKYQLEAKCLNTLNQKCSSLLLGDSSLKPFINEASIFMAGDSDMDMEEDVSPAASPVAEKCYIESDFEESTKLTFAESSIDKLLMGNENEVISSALPKDENPLHHIQGYASDDSSKDNQRNFISDVSPARASPMSSSDSHVEEQELYSNVGSTHSSKLKSQLQTHSVHTQIPSAQGQVNSESTLLTSTKMTSSLMSSPVQQLDIDNSVQVQMPNAQQQVNSESTSLASTKLTSSLMNSPVQRRDIDVMDGMVTNQLKNYGLHNNKEATEFCSSHFVVDEGANQDSAVPKTDEFGRILREGTSDSDSDGLQYKKSYMKKESSWSRSVSPQEDSVNRGKSLSRSPHSRKGRWRSRSPRRGKNKRNWSPSWSPNRQRSWSRSPPVSRQTSSISRRGRGHPQCFSFLQGRCRRGAACRFFHDAGRSRSKPQEYRDFPNNPAKFNVHKEDEHYAENREEDTVIREYSSISCGAKKGKDFLSCQELPDSRNLDNRKHSGQGMAEKNPQDYPDFPHNPIKNNAHKKDKHRDRNREEETVKGEYRSISHEVRNSSISHEVRKGREFLSCQELPDSRDLDYEKHSGQEMTEKKHQHSEPGIAITELIEDMVRDDVNPTLTSKVCQSDDMESSYVNVHQELRGQSQQERILISPEALSTSLGVDDRLMQHADDNPSISPDSSQKQQLIPTSLGSDRETSPRCSTSGAISSHLFVGHDESVPSHISPKISTLLAAQPASTQIQLSGAELRVQGFSSLANKKVADVGQMYANHVPDNHSFPQPTQSESQLQPLFASDDHSKSVCVRPSWSGAHLPSFYGETSLPAISNANPHLPLLPQSALPSTSGGLTFIRAEQSSIPTVASDPQVLYGHPRGLPFVSHSSEEVQVSLQQHSFNLPPVAQNNDTAIQPISSEKAYFSNQMHSFPEGSRSMGPHLIKETHAPTRWNATYSQLMPQNPQHPPISNFSSNHGAPAFIAPSVRSLASFPENNQQFQAGGISLPRNGAYYNPYASTFERFPAVSTSSAFGRETNIVHDNQYASFSLQHTSGKEHGSRVTGEQYDPLLDSIETPSIALKTYNYSLKEGSATFDAGTTSKISTLPMPADVEENNMRKRAPKTVHSFENDEFGETVADAEVGVVEDASPVLDDVKGWSPDDPIGISNPTAGEIEMDENPSLRKSKKSKDSRSMKHFKVAIAKFVKDVLKPSWRQGNMSKEAFKTIVKKTVDKVSSTIPSHRVPKNQAKINQYIDSSQRKLTKLVMGYVDKYVKM